jgi:hypothetical protein
MIKAAKQNHGLAQHKSALLYMLGVEPVDPDAKKVVFHTLPSVVSWAKSYVYSLNLGEAKPFSTKPSVVTWNNHMKKIEEKVGPNLEKAAEYHEQAANSGVLASQYAIAIAKETGLGTTVNQEESFTWYIVAASGQLGDGEGRMQGVEYICPHCLAWNPNRRLYIVCVCVCIYVCIYNIYNNHNNRKSEPQQAHERKASGQHTNNKRGGQQAHKRNAQGQQPVPAMQRRALLPQGSHGQESASRSPGVSICTFLFVLFY